MVELWAVVCIILVDTPKCEALPVPQKQLGMKKCQGKGEELSESFVAEILPNGTVVSFICHDTGQRGAS